MTFIGKLLAVLNLLVGLAILSWATTTYQFRPGWFLPISDEKPDKGSDPRSFASLKRDAEALTRAADIASGTWGANYKILTDLEERRDSRRKEFAKRLDWTENGRDKDGSNAFFTTVWEKDGAFVDTTKLGDAVKGPDDVPLKGIKHLGTNIAADVKEVQRLSQLIDKHRKDYAEVSVEILKEEARLLKMIEIRDSVQSELFYLSTFEVNVYETRETVLRRKRQLSQRLTELGGLK